MSLSSIFAADGHPARLDDMSPASRAFAVLLEHIARRRIAGIAGPCVCGECERLRLCLRGEPTEIPGECRIIYTPPVMP